VQIGERLALFKKSVEKDTASLSDYWIQWEEMQNDFIELGKEMFGNEAFPNEDNHDEIAKKGYSREMELLGIEYETRANELAEEIEDLRNETLQKTKTSEKVRIHECRIPSMVLMIIIAQALDTETKKVKAKVMELYMD
jgi:hypothetical protein